ncbi:sugar phosphate isomerase/epimerase [Angustibacter sp. Root456]|uniref:sugar phosphate isomerase/epimerase family protein n=1 Tax=Angustibacter sp. Root456 TaxID=1736539 RepID=UPI0006F59C22|nr:sugar phosphate isomerase/epimerase [Angustibacter sp. Root456]KQX61882.1 hypothetical protein ASD06_15145 [Angustibacter sp. Root456]
MTTTATDARVGVSTITFRFRPLDEALRLIAGLGAVEVDLGAIPAVTDHVPVPYGDDPSALLHLLQQNGLRAGAVNADVGDLNDPDYSWEALSQLATPLVELAAAVGGALIVPCGRASYEPFVDVESDLTRIVDNLARLSRLASDRGVRLLVEVLHHKRFVHSVARADEVLDALSQEQIGLLLDVSHVVASDEEPAAWAARRVDRIERVHLRDAVPGDLNLGIGRGVVDFAAVITTLERGGFDGSYILELETHDVAEDEREADARRSRELVLNLVRGAAAEGAA